MFVFVLIAQIGHSHKYGTKVLHLSDDQFLSKYQDTLYMSQIVEVAYHSTVIGMIVHQSGSMENVSGYARYIVVMAMGMVTTLPPIMIDV
jgi:hypothetical protein